MADILCAEGKARNIYPTADSRFGREPRRTQKHTLVRPRTPSRFSCVCMFRSPGLSCISCDSWFGFFIANHESHEIHAKEHEQEIGDFVASWLSCRYHLRSRVGSQNLQRRGGILCERFLNQHSIRKVERPKLGRTWKNLQQAGNPPT